MHNFFKSPLVRKLGLIIALVTITLKVGQLAISINQQSMELSSAQEAQALRAPTSKKVQLSDLKKNIVLLTLLTTLLLALAIIAVFKKVTGNNLFNSESITNLPFFINSKLTKDQGRPQYPENGILHNEQGTVLLSTEAMLDDLITHERHIESKLEIAQKELLQSTKLSLVGELTSGLVHDLKNPLSVVVSYNSLLKKPAYRAKKSEEELDTIYQKIEVATSRIQEMVDRMGKMGRSDQEFKEGTCLEEAIYDSLLFLKTKIAKNNVHVKSNVKALKVYGDLNMLEQVFSNLIANACDALAKTELQTREVEINAVENKNTVTITIKDSGPGIPQDVLPNIFDSFYTTKKRGEGTGLGLSTVKNIIESHKGKIEVGSTEGQGTVFSITLNKKKFS